MRQACLFLFCIMIHGFMPVLGSGINFNKEISLVENSQYFEHQKILKKTQATEAAFDFEIRYRKPFPNKGTAFFPLKIRPYQLVKPKTRVARSEKIKPGNQAQEWLRSESL